MIYPELHYLKLLLNKIEDNLGWGSSSGWTNYDFEKLADIILDHTSVNLSITTLKRIWGKLKYDNDPSTATLNTLAKYAGYTDWRRFLICMKEESPSPMEKISKNEPSIRHEGSQRKYLLTGGIAGMLLISYFLLSSIKKAPYINPKDFQFKADKMLTVGVPNSVVFTYNARAAKTDSVFIVQTWDIRRKTLVNRNGTNHSAIYYYPGYFRSKLIIDSVIVKTHDIQIATDGWLGLVEDRVPFYFSKHDIEKDSGISVSGELLQKNHFYSGSELPNVRFFNQRDMGDLKNDQFEFETKLRSEDSSGSNACRFTEVLIQCKDDIIIIPLCNRACVGDIGIYALGAHKEAKSADLSGFGADLSQWTTLKVTGHGKSLNFYVNGKPATSLESTHETTGIVGLQYRFHGAGSVKDTWFANVAKRWDF